MKELETISFRELKHYVGVEKCIIIYLRSRKMYETGHVKGAWNIPYEYLDRMIDRLPKENLLLLYCEHGGTALLAGRKLAEYGYRVKASVGGFEH